MPAFIAMAALGAAASAGVATLSGAAFSAAFASAFAGSLILGGLSKVLAKKPSDPAQSNAAGAVFDSQGRNLSIRQPISPWQVVVGESRVGGVITFWELSADKRYLHMIVTLACHESAAIEEVILGDEIINADMLNADGDVISGRYGAYQYPARVHSATIPGSPYQVTTSYTVHAVQSVTIADTYGDVESGQYITQTPLTDVSPSSPSSNNEYSRSGSTFTFYSGRAAAAVTINYTEQELHSGARIDWSLGDEGSAQPFPALVAASAGKWTSAHRQTGHTKLYIRFLTEGLLTGLPNVSAVVRGLKPYDSRTSTSHWSPTPALALCEYLIDDEFGVEAVFADEIDETDIEAAANICEERVLITGNAEVFTASASTDRLTLANDADGNKARTPRTGDGVRLTTTGTLPAGLSLATTYYVIRNAQGLVQLASSFANACAGTVIDVTDAGSGTHSLTPYDEPRYTANGSFLVSERSGEILEKLWGAMAGRVVHVSDRWHIFAGAYQAPSITLDESELAGAIRIDPMASATDTANGIRGVFVDPDANWQPTDFPPVSSDAYLALDNNERQWDDIDLSAMINSAATAQRLAKIELRRRRYALAWSAPFKLSAYRTMTAYTTAMDFAKYGWTGGAQEFEITNSRFVVVGGGNGEAPALNVELAFRQSDSDIWDWSLSEQQVFDRVKATNLPDPFTMTDPGVPTVTEELYETTGSAGVKARAKLSWSAGDSQTVARYNVRYKSVAASEYVDLPPVSQPSAQVDDLSAGFYLFAIQAVNSIGKASGWVTVTKELLGLAAAPTDLTNFSLTPIATDADLSWSKTTDLDVRIGGRILIRWSPKITGAVWNDGVEVANVAGDATTARVPHLTGTYLAKARDSSLNESVNAVSIITTAPDVDGYNAIASLTEHTTFTGTKSDVVVVDGALQLDGAVLIDDMTDPIDDWGMIDSAGGVTPTGTYDFSTYIDLGAVYTSRVTATLKTLAFDTLDTIDERLDSIDSWGLIDGPEISDCNVTLYVSTTDDNPAGAPTWSSWRPFLIGDYKARAFKFRAVLTSASQNHNIKIINLGVDVDMPDRETGAQGVASGTGTYSVSYTLSPAFKTAPLIGITAENMATGDYYTVTARTVSGFSIAFKNSAGAGVSRTFDWRAKGY